MGFCQRGGRAGQYAASRGDRAARGLPCGCDSALPWCEDRRLCLPSCLILRAGQAAGWPGRWHQFRRQAVQPGDQFRQQPVTPADRFQGDAVAACLGEDLPV
jgi:hypothetical protein